MSDNDRRRTMISCSACGTMTADFVAGVRIGEPLLCVLCSEKRARHARSAEVECGEGERLRPNVSWDQNYPANKALDSLEAWLIWHGVQNGSMIASAMWTVRRAIERLEQVSAAKALEVESRQGGHAASVRDLDREGLLERDAEEVLLKLKFNELERMVSAVSNAVTQGALRADLIAAAKSTRWALDASLARSRKLETRVSERMHDLEAANADRASLSRLSEAWEETCTKLRAELAEAQTKCAQYVEHLKSLTKERDQLREDTSFKEMRRVLMADEEKHESPLEAAARVMRSVATMSQELREATAALAEAKASIEVYVARDADTRRALSATKGEPTTRVAADVVAASESWQTAHGLLRKDLSRALHSLDEARQDVGRGRVRIEALTSELHVLRAAARASDDSLPAGGSDALNALRAQVVKETERAVAAERLLDSARNELREIGIFCSLRADGESVRNAVERCVRANREAFEVGCRDAYAAGHALGWREALEEAGRGIQACLAAESRKGGA